MSESKDRSEEILREVAALPTEQWEAYLAKHCGSDSHLRSQIEALLCQKGKETQNVNTAGRGFQPTIPHVSQTPHPADIVAGRFKLLEAIGEGGMGAIWLAEQKEPVRRKVAIKLVKAGMDSAQVLARFEAERQALAMMDHPNIAKIFDGGITEQGRPFFVMEFVKGVPLTEYCDQARLSVKERLNLFIPVCQAVQHAHQKGIIHRDLKPSNILVCLYDGKPVPKVIDFGLAKAMHQSLSENTIHTGLGVMVGTPLYMSPEQAEHNNLDVDTRTDIYSLGVILYELLTGTTPLEKQQVKQAAYKEILRLIKEVEPPKPSTRLSGSTSLPNIAAQRNIDPKQLRKSLSGDLDWIAMKALDKERSRRYETANGLARDVERFLNDEAVEASPPSSSYRLRKFVHKNRIAVTTVCAILLTLLLGIVGTGWGLKRALEAERAAKLSETSALSALRKETEERGKKEEALIAVTKQRELADQRLIRGMVHPIGHGEAVSETETRVFEEWSALDDANLQLRVLESAIVNPDIALRIANRAEYVVQAAIGISLKRREAIVRRMLAIQRDPALDVRTRVAACRLEFALGSNELPMLEESVRYLSAADEIEVLSTFLNAFINSTSPAQVTVVNRRLPIAISFHVSVGSMDARKSKLRSLLHLVRRTADDQIPIIVNAILAASEQSLDEQATSYLLELVSELAPRLNSTDAEKCVTAILNMLPKSLKSGKGFWDLTEKFPKALADSCSKMNEDSVRKLYRVHLEQFPQASDAVARQTSFGILEATAARMSKDELGQFGKRCLDCFENKSIKFASFEFECIYSFIAIAPRLDKTLVDRGVLSCVNSLDKPQNLFEQAIALSIVSDMIQFCDEGTVSRVWAKLLHLIEENGFEVGFMMRQADDLTDLTKRLKPEEKEQGLRVVLAHMRRSPGTYEDGEGSQFFAALTNGIGLEANKTTWDDLFAIAGESQSYVLKDKCYEILTHLAEQSEGELVSQRWALVMQLAINPFERWAPSNFARNLASALSPKLDSDEANKAATLMLFMMKTSRDSSTVERVSEIIGLLSDRLSQEHADSLSKTIFEILKHSNERFRRQAAAHTLNAKGWDKSIQKLGYLEDSVDRAMDHLRYAHDGTDARETASDYLKFLAPNVRKVVALKIMKDELDHSNHHSTQTVTMTTATGEKFPRTRYVNLKQLSFEINDPLEIAKLLSHPHCVDDPRSALIDRMEAIVYHNGELPKPAPAPVSGPPVNSAPTPGPASESEVAVSHFGDQFDVAKWIEKNYPNFDLESNMRVEVRGPASVTRTP